MLNPQTSTITPLISGDQGRRGLDTSRVNPARVWNYWLGGKDNYPTDQEFGAQVRAVVPAITDIARAERGFLLRAVSHLVSARGIHQFLDLNPGLPTTAHTHQVAQAITPDCRVVYVAHDPLVLAHARALLTSTTLTGHVAHLHADVHDPEPILQGAARTLDLVRPVAVILLGVLNFLVEDDQAHALVTGLLDALPVGSYLLLSHLSADLNREAMRTYTRLWNEHTGAPIMIRCLQQLTGFFDRLKLLEPGVVPCSLWRPDPHQLGIPAVVDVLCGVGRKLGVIR